MSEQTYMPFELACQTIRRMLKAGPEVKIKFRFISTFLIEYETEDGSNLPGMDMSKTFAAMKFPVARPGTKTQIGSM